VTNLTEAAASDDTAVDDSVTLYTRLCLVLPAAHGKRTLDHLAVVGRTRSENLALRDRARDARSGARSKKQSQPHRRQTTGSCREGQKRVRKPLWKKCWPSTTRTTDGDCPMVCLDRDLEATHSRNGVPPPDGVCGTTRSLTRLSLMANASQHLRVQAKTPRTNRREVFGR